MIVRAPMTERPMAIAGSSPDSNATSRRPHLHLEESPAWRQEPAELAQVPFRRRLDVAELRSRGRLRRKELLRRHRPVRNLGGELRAVGEGRIAASREPLRPHRSDVAAARHGGDIVEQPKQVQLIQPLQQAQVERGGPDSPPDSARPVMSAARNATHGSSAAVLSSTTTGSSGVHFRPVVEDARVLLRDEGAEPPPPRLIARRVAPQKHTQCGAKEGQRGQDGEHERDELDHRRRSAERRGVRAHDRGETRIPRCRQARHQRQRRVELIRQKAVLDKIEDACEHRQPQNEPADRTR